MAETCFCHTGLNRFKPRFKPPLAETCQTDCRLSHLLHLKLKLHWLDIKCVQYKLGVTMYQCLLCQTPQALDRLLCVYI